MTDSFCFVCNICFHLTYQFMRSTTHQIQDSRSFYCLKYKHHKQHGNNSIIYIRQRDVETVWDLFTTHGKNSSSCTYVDQWQQKGLVVHRKIIFPPYEAYDENGFFFFFFFFGGGGGGGGSTVMVLSIQFFSLKEVEQGNLIWLHLRR